LKHKYLFFILITSTLTVSIIAGQRSEAMMECEFGSSCYSFVSTCMMSSLAERVNKYRAKIDDLLKRGKHGKTRFDVIYALLWEMARQGDFEGLDQLEKDLPRDLKEGIWVAVSGNHATDDAKKLLVKWQKENPTVPLLMEYHADGVELLIKMAEDKNAPVDDRAMCLEFLGRMPAATKVLYRVKALMSDQTICVSCMISAPGGVLSMTTMGSVAAEVVKKLEAIKLQGK
jgi:hypothetical protein